MKFLFFIFLVPSLVFGFSKSDESQCTKLDLRNNSLGAVRDQGKISWCYAFAGADMLAHAMGITRAVSAADIAISYNETLLARLMNQLESHTDHLPHQTGFNKIALNKILKVGLCPEVVFPSEYWIKVQHGKEFLVPMPEAMKEIYDLFFKVKKYRFSTLPFYYRFEHVDELVFQELLKSKNLRHFYSELRSIVCQSDRFKNEEALKARMIFVRQSIFKDISEILDSGTLVGVDYDSRVLEDHTHKTRSFANLHTSVIVARRWNQNQKQCEYLIRNSHGRSCEKYDSYFSCEEGHIWVGEAELYPNLTSIVYLNYSSR